MKALVFTPTEITVGGGSWRLGGETAPFSNRWSPLPEGQRRRTTAGGNSSRTCGLVSRSSCRGGDRRRGANRIYALKWGCEFPGR